MTHENFSALRIDINECIEKPPRDYINPIEPENSIWRRWVPQSMGEQIWLVWEFKSVEERKQFEKDLPTDVSRWLDRDVIDYVI